MPSGLRSKSPYPPRRGATALGLAALMLVLGCAAASAADSPPGGNATSPAGDKANRYYADIWAPRSKTGTIHLHGGVFAPVNANANGTTMGMRLGVNAGTHVLLGVMGDWSFQSKNLLQPTTSDWPGLQPKLVLANVNAHLVPAMAFIQVRLTDRFPIVPYGGLAGGYEWLLLRAKDYRTGQTADLTYANWAWQGYTGVGLRLSEGLRIDGEVYYNGGALERDVADANGLPLKEAVDVNGVGARFGLDIVY